MEHEPRRTFAEYVYAAYAEEEQRVLDNGGTELEAQIAASDALQAAVDDTAAELADRLVATAPGMLAEHRRLARGFERRLRKHWGEALDFVLRHRCVR